MGSFLVTSWGVFMKSEIIVFYVGRNDGDDDDDGDDDGDGDGSEDVHNKNSNNCNYII